MKHIVKIMSLVVVISAFWIGLLEASVVPRSYGWLLPTYFIVSLGCYGLLMVGVGLMRFPTCAQEARLLQQCDVSFYVNCLLQSAVVFIIFIVVFYNGLHWLVGASPVLMPICATRTEGFQGYGVSDIAEAKDFLKQRGVNVGSD